MAVGLMLPAVGAPLAAQWPEAVRTALEAGDADALAAALEAGADPDARAEGGLQATALMYATSNPDPAMARVLIEAGADIHVRDTMGDPAVNWAAYYGHAAIVQMLFEAGADGEASGHGSVAEIALRRGHQATLAVALDATGQAPARLAVDAVLERAVIAGDTATVAAIAEWHDVASARDWAGRPLTHAAAGAGQAETLGLLLANGADPDAVDAIGYTALFEAARTDQVAIVEQLIEVGADLNRAGAENGMALTAVHLAAIAGHTAMLSRLAEAGADLDVQGVSGATPLYWAAFEGQREAVLALLDAGADPDVRSETAPGFAEIAEMLDWPDVAARLAERAAE
ncbi:hypothetical protein AWH62_02250 [Maricaulis sp. W15]|uniref:ankyrin repeat domain-containing protein n=1 Tax=Maricaulis sp. W15 TaxID=1772333 RepID=UPI000948DDA8|nr:ankyrin repeat domain-containing protein [Maricaulis sp. W15]OLF81514.1 hypothetical protein AWH62_02250 [Maricaulis sp. W15]